MEAIPVEADLGLFNEEKATEAILWFLDRTGVGKKPRERPLDEFDGDEPEEIT
jgi:hypothetical protein